MFDLLDYYDLLMLRDGIEILQPDGGEALDRQGRLMAEITNEIESRLPKIVEHGYVVAVVLKVNVTAVSREEARAKAIELLNERIEDQESWQDVPAWQTLNVKPERTTDPLNCAGDERVWASSDYERDDLAGNVDYVEVR